MIVPPDVDNALRRGLQDQIAHLFQIFAAATDADSGAEYFRNGLRQCLERYETACEIAAERVGD